MAQIPLGNFGNVMPQSGQGRVLDTGAGQVGQSLNTLAQVGQQASAKQLNEQQRIQDEKDEYAFNVEASKYSAQYQDTLTETKQKLVTGELNEQSAKDYLQLKNDELRSNFEGFIPEKQKNKFNYYTEKTFIDSQQIIKPLAYETEKNKINADFEQVSEATLKLENREQAEALFNATLARNPVLTPEQRVTQLDQWKQRRDLTDGKGVLSNLETAKDIEGLQKVHDDVDSIFPNMKVETRDAYKTQIQNAIDRLNHEQAVAQQKALNEAKQIANDFSTDAYTGFPISAERTDAVLAKVAGTEYEAQVREDLAMNKEAQAFRKLSPLEQERRISSITTSLEGTPQSDGSLLQRQLNMFKAISTTTKQRANNDPMALLPNVGHVAPELIGTGKANFKQAQLTTQILAENKQKNGGVGSLIQWNTSERKAFTDRYFDATPQQQRTMLTDLTKMVGDNKDAQLEYFKLISPNNPYDYVGVAKLNQMDVVLHGTNVRVADLILEGKHLLKTGEDKLLGSQKEFENQVASEFGNSTTKGQLEYRTYANMAYSAYIGLAKHYPDKIKVDEKGKPFINKELAKQAFDVTTGGTYKQKFGKNTNTVFMPYGYTQDTFQDYLEEHFRTTFKKETGIVYDLDILNEYAVRRKAGYNHLFEFVQPNGVVLNNPRNGKPYFIAIPPIQK
ncbi:hypothetical protein [Acinetobacter bereziniae]|uniref:hypothetical protein n=1 Tax=Acinetobacter bereziniae TaxID=106648 RepID=UPI0019010BB1|nr:hypothetical protein [Acinetobacter bereziniae]MBJ8445893.1 hypothetical protein [Acinetobacter bereziniae]